MVARDLIHQTALEDRQPVAKANDDVAPEVFFRFEKQAVRILTSFRYIPEDMALSSSSKSCRVSATSRIRLRFIMVCCEIFARIFSLDCLSKWNEMLTPSPASTSGASQLAPTVVE